MFFLQAQMSGYTYVYPASWASRGRKNVMDTPGDFSLRLENSPCRILVL